MWFPFFCGRGEDNTVDDDGFPIMGKTLYPFSITPEDEKLLPELKELFTTVNSCPHCLSVLKKVKTVEDFLRNDFSVNCTCH